MMIITDGTWFKDEHGRTLLLRGVNLGGSSKVPFEPDGATYRREGFYNHRQVSFVGRPFPVEQADEHFARLREWGLTFLRFLITWEAIEHAGQGHYDEAYLDYLAQVIEKAGEHGFTLYIDPHQDVWSRFSGGDGAPGWTFEAAGLDITKFEQTGAAIRHQIHGDPFPRMIWPMNAFKLASATMFTLFFGGDDFAPLLRVDGEGIQDFLQRHYMEAIKQVAKRLRSFPHVIGYDVMNEPSAGYIGWADLNDLGRAIRLGACPTPYQSMLLGAGHPQEVDVFGVRLLGLRRIGSQMINRGGEQAWLQGFGDIWRKHGVWDKGPDEKPCLLRPDYFGLIDGRMVDFTQDYYRPFANRFAREIRSVHPRALVFIESEPGHKPPFLSPAEAEGVVWAPHWYDGFTLTLKKYLSFLAATFPDGRLLLGSKKIRRNFTREIAWLKSGASHFLHGVPTLIGEFGIPYDLDGKKAYRNGDFRDQIRAMDRSFRAMEENLISCTIWNYTADNSNKRGDQWNDEDLSIFSRDQQDDASDLHSGGRALEGVVRPYAARIAGEPLHMSFDIRNKSFEFRFRHDANLAAATEIFLPRYHYPRGVEVTVSDGSFKVDLDKQILEFRHSDLNEIHSIRICPA